MMKQTVLKIFAPIIVLAGAAFASVSYAQNTGPTCSAPWNISQTLSNGARWEMCWERRDREGVVLSDIHYTNVQGIKRKVLAEIAVAQIHVPYDDNRARYHDVSDYGLGTSSHQNDLAPADCPGGQLVSDGTKNVVCRQYQVVASQGVLGSSSTVTSELVVFSVSHVGAYNYIPQYTFFDDGTIEPAMGATGRLQRFRNETQHGWPMRSTTAGNFAGVSHLHNYYWRLDFDLAGDGTDDVFEEINVNQDSNNRKRIDVTAFSRETARQVSPEKFRRWRVRDTNIRNNKGAHISYEITAADTGHRDIGPSYEPWTFADVYLTRARGCERFASHNPADSLGGCGSNGSLATFNNNESVAGQDQVVWFGLSFHHIPRDEDEPHMHAHWNRFQIRPRDWNDAIAPTPTLPSLVTAHDFEVSTGWVRDSQNRDSAVAGSWQLGVPQQTLRRGHVMQPGNAAQGQSALVTGLAAGNSAGDYDVDNGRTSIRSQPIYVAQGTRATLDFSFFFAHSRSASDKDFYKVKLITDSGVEVLLYKKGSPKFRSAIWKKRSFDISRYMGSYVSVELVAKDVDRQNVLEAGFDDLKIVVDQ